MNDTLPEASPSRYQCWLTRWKEPSETLRNGILVLAVLIGGGWTLYTFVALKQAERADMELSRAMSRLNLSIDADAKQLDLPGDGGFLIQANVTMTNIGIQPIQIDYRSGKPDPETSKSDYVAPLAVYKVAFKSTGELETFFDKSGGGTDVFEKSIKGHPMTIPSKEKVAAVATWELIRVGESRTTPFVVKVPEPGLYLVSYRVPVDLDSNNERAIYKQFTGKDDPHAAWSARTFITINATTP